MDKGSGGDDAAGTRRANRPKDAIAPTMSSVRKPVLGAKSVGSFVPRLTRQAFEKFGFSAATLITDWATIVGADLARYTEPERLRWPKAVAMRSEVDDIDQGRPGATLILRVDPGRALDIQYKGRQIIERINAYFGYRAVADVRIIQGTISTQLPSRAARVAAIQPAARIEVTGVADDGLRAALEGMAAGLAARRAERTQGR